MAFKQRSNFCDRLFVHKFAENNTVRISDIYASNSVFVSCNNQRRIDNGFLWKNSIFIFLIKAAICNINSNQRSRNFFTCKKRFSHVNSNRSNFSVLLVQN